MSRAPLLEGWDEYRRRRPTAWTTPGHKGRTDLVGDVVRDDVPLYGGVDTIREQHGRLVAAQRMLAQTWDADWARISVGGSTHGNQALCLAAASPGDEVVVNRNLHRSQLIGLVLAGLVPVWVTPDVDASVGLPTGVPVDRLADALRRHPSVRAVFLVEPGYVGTLSDVAGHAAVAHEHGVPLVVDQAWGAHFGFHPSLPAHGLAVGADALVMSAHKTLPAYTQAAFVVARTERLDRDRLDRSFDALATTSPSGTIVASADAARALLQERGEQLVAELLDVAAEARAQLRAVEGVVVVDEHSLPGARLDPTKVVVSLAGAGVDGLALEELLVEAGHPVEMADHDTVIPLLTLADTHDDVASFVSAFVDGVEQLRGEPRDVVPSVAWGVVPEVVMPPRDAFFARHRVVDAAAAVGKVSAELVAPYPPGVPVLAPGERVTEAALDGLHRALAAGTQVRYAADPSLRTLQVVA